MTLTQVSTVPEHCTCGGAYTPLVSTPYRAKEADFILLPDRWLGRMRAVYSPLAIYVPKIWKETLGG